jgi:D-sedoheptulose 7-phosphate isomerase
MSQLPASCPPQPPLLACGITHVDALRTALDAFGPCVQIADRWGRSLASRLTDGRRLLTAGNGGSAAQAQHLSAEIVGRYRDDRRPFSAMALHAETSSFTAILNDYGPDEVFARQVEAHGRPGDVLVLLSTSGRSPNVVNAARRGRQLGLVVWAFTGPAPNPLAMAADEVLAVDAAATATVQELHLVALHLVCAAFDVALGVSRDSAVAGNRPVRSVPA